MMIIIVRKNISRLNIAETHETHNSVNTLILFLSVFAKKNICAVSNNEKESYIESERRSGMCKIFN